MKPRVSAQNVPPPPHYNGDKEWTKTLIAWLRQVNPDLSLPPGSVSIRTVGRAVRALKAAGHLKVTRRGVERPNWYHIILKSGAPAALDLDIINRTPASDHNVNDRTLLSDQNVNDRTPVSDVIGQHCPTIRLSLPPKPTNLPDEAARARATTDDRAIEEATGAEPLISQWQALLAGYPSSSKMNLGAGRHRFEQLSPDAREWAIESAPKYRAEVRPGAEPTHLATWLRDRRFELYPRSSRGHARATARVFVREGTAEWGGRIAAGHPRDLITADPEDRTRSGWYFEPRDAERALAPSGDAVAYGVAAPGERHFAPSRSPPAHVGAFLPLRRSFGRRS